MWRVIPPGPWVEIGLSLVTMTSQINLHSFTVNLHLASSCERKWRACPRPFTYAHTNWPDFSSLFLLSENVQNCWSDTTMISVACRTLLEMFCVAEPHFVAFFTTFQDKHRSKGGASVAAAPRGTNCKKRKKKERKTFCDHVKRLQQPLSFRPPSDTGMDRGVGAV